MNIENIEAFLTVAKYKNMSRAASRLHESQPTVSNRIRALEDELGMQLFVRRKGVRGVELTRQGEQFIYVAEQWFVLYKDAAELKNAEPVLSLGIGCPDTVMTALLPPLFKRIQRMSPRVVPELFNFHSDELYQALDSRVIDIGIGFNMLSFANINADEIFEESYYLMLPPGAEAGEGMASAEGLDKRREIYVSWNGDYAQWHDNRWDARIRPKAVIDTISLIPYLMDSPGDWMVVPYSVARYMQNTAGFTVLPLAQQPPARKGYLFTQTLLRPRHAEAVDIFRAELTAFCAEVFGDKKA